MQALSAVTGAFGFTGAAITRQLLASGRQVRTLTGHPERANPFGDQIEVARLAFDDPDELTRSLEGCETLFNTYWVRFTYGSTSFDQAVANTKTLIRAAESAGVRRIVHLSITNPSLDSPFPYFSGKAQVEQAIRESRLSSAILRPAVIFGTGDILINNIAWLLRNLPIFGVPGDGSYQLQPVYVEDVARLAICAGLGQSNSVKDAVGPQVFPYTDLVRLIAESIGTSARILRVAPWTTHVLSRALGVFLRDLVLTREEIDGLMANLLVSSGSATCPTKFSEWLRDNSRQLGQTYASELARHYR
jgi:NADH dehydrogenase